MHRLRKKCKGISTNKWFEISITLVIVVNSILIGVETYTNDSTVKFIQQIILGIFTIEILIRFIASDSVKSFFTDGWNIFDLTLVLIGYIPENLVPDAQMMMGLRVLRVFRVLRLLRAAKEIKLIMTVLVKSLSAMFYNLIIFLIFVYLYAIVGVSMFRLPNPDELSGDELARYEKLMDLAPHAPTNSPDPFGTLGEAVFTLFRELTGEDWTDLRYNHITAYELGILKTSPTVITTYHVSWFCLAAFLLLNLVTGAVINNYQIAIEEQERRKKEKRKARENSEYI